MKFRAPQLIPPTPARNLYLLVQVLVGSLVLIAVRAIYFSHPYYSTYISYEARQWLAALFWILLAILWLDSLLKYLFMKQLPVSKFSLMFVYLYQCAVGSGRWAVGGKTIPGSGFRGQGTVGKQVTSNLEILGLRPGIKQRFQMTQDPGNRFYMNAETKTAFLSILVKFFFLPIMLNTVTANLANLLTTSNDINAGRLLVNFDTVYNLLITSIFLLDTAIFAFAYTFEAGWLRSRIRSVEPSMLGWVVALATYPPFNGLTGQFFPMFTDGTTALAQNELSLRLLQILILICHFIFVSASVSLFTKGSNLTNRGIVGWGPYALVRHPAYTVKLTAFLLEGFLYATTFSYYLGWLGFAVLYYLRAWTEERHLSMDLDYLAYKKDVRWKFIPGLF